MSKYIIVSKSGRGNMRGSVYTITYQVENYSGNYKCDMYCMGTLEGRKGKYVYLEGNEYPFIITKDDKDDFIEQIKLFQEGSSYRKAHPIKKSDLDILIDQKKEYEEKLDDIEDKIEKEKYKLFKQEIKDYQTNIDKDSLFEFESKFKELFYDGCRYILLPDNFSINQNMWVYDTKLKKIVKVYEMHNHKILSREPLESEIKRFLRK